MADERIPDHTLVTTPVSTDMFRTRQAADTRDKRTTRVQIHTLESGEKLAAAATSDGLALTASANVTTAEFDAGDNQAGNLGCLSSIKSAIATVNSVAAATLTATGLIPAGSFLIGLTARITTSFGTSTGLTDFDVGDGTDVDRWANSLGITAGTTMDISDGTAATQGSFNAANDVVLTAVGGNFDATGVIELIAHYITLTAPTG